LYDFCLRRRIGLNRTPNPPDNESTSHRHPGDGRNEKVINMKKTSLSLFLLSLPIIIAAVPMWIIVGLPTPSANSAGAKDLPSFIKAVYTEESWGAAMATPSTGIDSATGDIAPMRFILSEGRSAFQAGKESQTDRIPPRIALTLLGIGVIGFFGCSTRSGQPKG
jgi:hypothetical protein